MSYRGFNFTPIPRQLRTSTHARQQASNPQLFHIQPVVPQIQPKRLFCPNRNVFCTRGFTSGLGPKLVTPPFELGERVPIFIGRTLFIVFIAFAFVLE